MKALILLLLLTSWTIGQEVTHLDVPLDSPLYQQLQVALQGKKLPIGTELSLRIVPATPSTSVATATPASSTFLSKSANFERFRGSKLPANIVRTATRSGDLPKLKIVALSPSNRSTTVRPQPRLWWYQSENTDSRELEFVLTRINEAGTGTTLFRRDMPTMKKGYNVIDLSNPSINPESHKLEAGIAYQWTVNHRNGETNSPVFARLIYEPNSELLNSVLTKPANPETLSQLNAKGNWHELLDTYCTLAARMKQDASFAALRDKLLESASLLEMLK